MPDLERNPYEPPGRSETGGMDEEGRDDRGIEGDGSHFDRDQLPKAIGFGVVVSTVLLLVESLPGVVGKIVHWVVMAVGFTFLAWFWLSQEDEDEE